jgi:HlyD family secretion protein
MNTSGMNHYTPVTGSAIYRLILLFVMLSIGVLPFIKTTVSVTARGIVRPAAERTELKPVLSGTIDSIFVKEGETVQKGQLIAVLRNEITQPKQVQQDFEFNQRRVFIEDLERLTTSSDLKLLSLQSAFYRQQLNKVVFELERMEAAIRKVNRELEINKQLIKDKIIAPKEQFDKEIEAESLAASYNAFKNEQLSNWQFELQRYRQENAQYAVHKKQLETETNNHFIYAPVSGVVQNINTRYKGGFISSGETICLLSPVGGLIGECYVTAKDVGLLKVGLQARFQIDAFHYNHFGILTGKVLSIADDFSIIENRPVFKVRCSFDTTRLVLKNGYSGELKKGLSFQSRFVVAERTLWQLLFDKVDDWLNPTAPVLSKSERGYEEKGKNKATGYQ